MGQYIDRNASVVGRVRDAHEEDAVFEHRERTLASTT